MKGNKLLSSLLVGATMFAMTAPNVSALTFDKATTDTDGHDINTQYSSASYSEETQDDYYSINLDYSDLSWTFVYEGDITNPTKSRWVNTSYYDSALQNEHNGEVDDLVNDILNNNAGLDSADIKVTNNSNFTVNTQAEIVNKVQSGTSYANTAGLQLAISSADNGLSYTEMGQYGSGSVSGTIENGYYRNVGVKPTATRFVNDSGDTAQVAGEIKLTFSKAE